MILSQLVKPFTKTYTVNLARFYTVIVERIHKPLTMKKNVDQRKTPLKSRHLQYRFVDCLHVKPWGNIDLILTQYVEGKHHIDLMC